jgi:uncharacterized membrane protein YgcG
MIRPDRGAQLALPFLLLLAACSAEPTAPDAPSADEEQQLNDAAAMLDANSVSLDNLDNGAVQ